MCLNPVPMYYGAVNPDSGKRSLSAHCPNSRLTSEPDLLVPCGKCAACLDSRRKTWIRRLQFELWTNPIATYCTLTYDDAHLPSDRMASKYDIQCFLKRLRNASRDYGIPRFSVKYFLASEYGKKHARPHYHAVIFGIDCKSPCWRPEFLCMRGSFPLFTSHVLSDIWRNGYVTVDDVNSRSIHYVAKYVSKQYVDRDSWIMYSQGLGRDYFVGRDSLLSTAYDAYRNGFIACRAGDNIYKSPIPRWLDRYADRFDPVFIDFVRAGRLETARHKQADLRPMADREYSFIRAMKDENAKRCFDNET